MAVVRSFHKYRGASSFTIPEIIGVLKEQLPLIAPKQSRYRVSSMPSARTVRFYTARGLVDKPTGHQGAHALYGYRHLLQILAVKYLQSQYLPLVKIRSLMSEASNRDLELLIPEITPAVQRGLAREERRDASARELLTAAAAPARIEGEEPPPGPRGSGGGDVVSQPDAWHRIEVSPGIELHVHAVALPEEGRERLRAALLKELGRMRGWFDAG